MHHDTPPPHPPMHCMALYCLWHPDTVTACLHTLLVWPRLLLIPFTYITRFTSTYCNPFPPVLPTSFLRSNSCTKSRQKSQEFSSLLFTVTSAAMPWDFYFFKLMQPLTVSTVQLLYTVKEKGRKPDRKPYLPSLWFKKSAFRNLKSENSHVGSWIRLYCKH